MCGARILLRTGPRAPTLPVLRLPVRGLLRIVWLSSKPGLLLHLAGARRASETRPSIMAASCNAIMGPVVARLGLWALVEPLDRQMGTRSFHPTRRSLVHLECVPRTSHAASKRLDGMDPSSLTTERSTSERSSQCTLPKNRP